MKDGAYPHVTVVPRRTVVQLAISVALLMSAALLSSSCYVSQWVYETEHFTDSYHGWSLRWGFCQETVTGVPEFDRGDTTFILFINCWSASSICSTELSIERPVIIRSGASDTLPLGIPHIDRDGANPSLGVWLGPWRRGKMPDTVFIEFDLIAKDKATREELETERLRIVGILTQDKTGVMRAMVRGI
jgi:hypothetical protein